VVREFGPPFVDGIVRLLSSRELRRRIGERARRSVERDYDWRAIASKLEKVYEECIAE
jgi:glycosyltransferase involved in cell wall biosynthesis